MDATASEKLRAKFPPEQIGKLPKPTKKENPKGNCQVCGGYHGLPAIHLDFVGHAHVTERIISVDPDYEFGPVLDINKRPIKSEDGSVLYFLTILGSTKYEWGDGPNMKEISSDAIRRCAMRFGIALDLWAKEPLAHEDSEPESAARSAPAAQGRVERAAPQPPPKKTTTSQQQKIAIAAADADIDTQLRYRITRLLFGVTSSKDVNRGDVTRLLEAFKAFQESPQANMKYLEAWEAENLPSTAAQHIREGNPRTRDVQGDAASPSASVTSPPDAADGEHILTREDLETPGQTNFDTPAIPD